MRPMLMLFLLMRAVLMLLGYPPMPMSTIRPALIRSWVVAAPTAQPRLALPFPFARTVVATGVSLWRGRVAAHAVRAVRRRHERTLHL